MSFELTPLEDLNLMRLSLSSLRGTLICGVVTQIEQRKVFLKIIILLKLLHR